MAPAVPLLEPPVVRLALVLAWAVLELVVLVFRLDILLLWRGKLKRCCSIVLVEMKVC